VLSEGVQRVLVTSLFHALKYFYLGPGKERKFEIIVIEHIFSSFFYFSLPIKKCKFFGLTGKRGYCSCHAFLQTAGNTGTLLLPSFFFTVNVTN